MSACGVEELSTGTHTHTHTHTHTNTHLLSPCRYNVHALSSLLKSFLSALDDPLIPCYQHSPYLEVLSQFFFSVPASCSDLVCVTETDLPFC